MLQTAKLYIKWVVQGQDRNRDTESSSRALPLNTGTVLTARMCKGRRGGWTWEERNVFFGREEWGKQLSKLEA